MVELIKDAQGAARDYGDTGLDETFDEIRDEMRRFSEAEVVPHAQEWHLKDELIPLPLVEQMGELGVFGLTIPEEFGGLGLGKTRCASSPRSSRAAISAWARSARARRSPRS